MKKLYMHSNVVFAVKVLNDSTLNNKASFLRKTRFKKYGAHLVFSILIFLMFNSNPIFAQSGLEITSTGTPFNQTFDGMGSSPTATTPTGFKIGPDWSTGTSATTLAAGTSGTGILNGTSSGGTYNFANGVTASSTDRALGFLSSGSFASPRSIVLKITNTSGATISSLEITFDYEKYRSGTRQFDWTFFHGDITSPTTSETAGNQSYAANASNTVISNPPLTTSKTVSLSGLSIPNGVSYYLKWTYTGLAGSTNAQGIGIDNFSITASASGPSEPSCISNPVAPANAATGVSLAGTTLTWTNPGTATSYDVYFGTDNPPTNIVNGVNQTDPTVTFETGALSPATTYFWSIIPRNAIGAAVGPCSIWSFVTLAPPTCIANPISPLDGQTGIPLAGTILTWPAVSGATGYDVYFGNPLPSTPNFTNLVGTQSPTGVLQTSIDYFWMIVPRNPLGSASGCSTWSFTSISPPSNDNCSNAININPTTTCINTSGITINASEEFAPTSCDGGTSSSANDVWYSFISDGISEYTINASTNDISDLVLGFYLSCDEDSLISCADAVVSGTESITTGLLSAGTYFYRIYGFDGASGTFNTCVTKQCPTIPSLTLVNQTRCGDGDVTFTVNDPGPSYTVEWSTDGINNNDGSGLSKTKTVTVGSPITVYARISLSADCKGPFVSATGTANTFISTSVIYTENFGTGTSFPTGWDNAFSGTPRWSISTASTSSGYPNASGGSNALVDNSAAVNSSIVSSTIDFSGLTNGVLKVGMRRSSTGFLRDIAIDVSTDDGVSFSPLTSILASDISSGSYSLITFDLGASINNASHAKIRFRLLGAPGTSGPNFRMDDVTICGTSNEVSISKTDSCDGTSTLTANGISSYSYLWTLADATTATTQTIIIDSIGNYSVTATNEFGCSSTASIDITSLLHSDAVTINETSCNPANVGTAVQTLTNQVGCDSVVTTITTLLNSDSVVINATSCDPGQVGTVVQTLTNQAGCDSVVTTITTLLNSDAVTVNATTCNPANVGTVVQTLTNQAGCDSIVTTITTLVSGDAITINATTCNPANEGTVIQTLTNQAGCDSIVTTITTLVNTDAVTVNATTCNPANVGTVVQTLTNQAGCDSIVTTITTLVNSDAVTVNATTCNPANVGTVVQTLTNQAGCDSIVTTITTLVNSDAVTVNATTCNPANVGTVVQTLTNQAGCDSMVTTITTLVNSDAVTVNATTCNPANVGTVVQTLTNQAGCDSIVTTITTLVNSDAVTVNATTCNPANVGTVVQTLTNQAGCDSIVTTITTLSNSDAVTVNATSCNPANVGIVVQTLTNQAGCDSIVTTITTLVNSDAVTVNATTCNPANVGTVVQTLTNQAGCDSIVTTITTLLNSDAITINATTCNPANVGTVVQTLTNQAGCDSIVTTITVMLNMTVSAASSTPTLCITENIVTSATGDIWMDRNLGALQVATSSSDSASFGDFYQWGRGMDGHQISTSGTTSILSGTDVPGHSNFIIGSTDWRSPQNDNLWQGVNGVNNPCPTDFRLPTEAELEAERLSWSSNDAVGALASPLKLPMAGTRLYSDGTVIVGPYGNYWTSTVNGTNARVLGFDYFVANTYITNYERAYGFSVRCISDGPSLAPITHTTSGATGIGAATGLPAGVTATWAANVITITGTPTESGVFNYSIPLTGGCGTVNATGTITVTPSMTAASASSTPTLCPNTALTNITHATTLATSIGVATGLPAGVTATWAANVITISGTPTELGVFNYSIPLTGGCGTVNATGTITVTPSMTVSGASSTPTLCVTENIVTSATGDIWMDRNLGALQVATSSTDIASYGYLYQWGRGNDGHQIRTSTTTSTLSGTDAPGHANFIVNPNSPYDWRSPQNDNLWQGVNGVNNPCPTNFRIPTQAELDAERLSWGTQDAAGAFASPLKLPQAGYRHDSDGSLDFSTHVYYWSSTVDGIYSSDIYFDGSIASTFSSARAYGFSVRCISDGPTLAPITHTTTSATGIGAATGLPAGVTATWAANVITITGTPTESGVFNYSIPLTGGCGTVNATGTITVTPSMTVSAASSTPTICITDNLVTSSTGKVWMDRNLGASQVATSSSDSASFGNFYQWGRGIDGHQISTSDTTSTLSGTDEPGHGNFIIGSTDWRSPQNDNLWQGVIGVNNVCPTDFRIPTEAELDAERLSWSSNDAVGALASPLKWPLQSARYYSDGTVIAGPFGNYWSSTVDGTNARSLGFDYLNANTHMNSYERAFGFGIRCIRDGAPLIDITHITTGATGIGVATGLPAGVTATWAANVITISGTPTESGVFNYNIPLTGGCGTVNATGTITTLLTSDPITINATTCNPANVGTVVQTFTNQAGCDSVVTTITTLSNGDAVTINATTCNPANAGTVVQTLTNQAGCDSVVTTITTLSNGDAVTINATTCNPANVGTVVQTLTNQAGCDSIVTTITTLVNSDAVTVNATTCNPANVGTVVQTLTNQAGCDSVVTTITTLVNSDAVTVNATTCNPANVGTVVQTLTNQAGCDSVVTTITTLLNSDAITINATTCNPANVGTVVQTLTNQAGCDSVVTTITTLVSVRPGTPTAINGSRIICPLVVYTYFIAPVANAQTYFWKVPFFATILSGQGTTSVEVQFSVGYTVGSMTVQSINCAGTSTARPLSVSLKAKPGRPVTISGQTPVCFQTYLYSCTPVANADSYTWTAPANATILSGQGTLTVEVQFLNGFTSGNLSVAASNCGGTSVDRVKLITLKAKPATPSAISGIRSICPGTYTYSVTLVATVDSYNWAVPANATLLSGQGTSSVLVEFLTGYTTGSLTVTASNCGGTSAARSITISNTVATPSTISGLTTVCPSATGVSYTIVPVNGATSYVWEASGGASISSGQGTTSITVDFPGSYSSLVVRVKSVNSCSVSGWRSLTVSSCPGRISRATIAELEPIEIKAYPNPFINSTTIAFTVPKKDNVRLAVFNLEGRELQQLYIGDVEGQTEYQFQFNADNSMSAGIYFYRLETNNDGKVTVGKIILVK